MATTRISNRTEYLLEQIHPLVYGSQSIIDPEMFAEDDSTVLVQIGQMLKRLQDEVSQSTAWWARVEEARRVEEAQRAARNVARRGLTVEDIPEGSDAMLGAFIAAKGYYSGMMTALYALSSTGSLELYPGEGLSRIIVEMRSALLSAEEYYPEDAHDLRSFLDWLLKKDEEMAQAAPSVD